MQSIIAVTNKHTAKLHHVGSFYILTYDTRKLKHKISMNAVTTGVRVASPGHIPTANPRLTLGLLYENRNSVQQRRTDRFPP